MENNFIKEPKIVGILSRMDLYCHVDHLTRICRKWQWPISIEIQASFYRNSSKSVSINQFGCRGENITITEATNHLHRNVLYTSSTQRFPIQSIHPLIAPQCYILLWRVIWDIQKSKLSNWRIVRNVSLAVAVKILPPIIWKGELWCWRVRPLPPVC